MQRQDFRDKVRHIPFAREGIPYVLMAGFATLILAVLQHHVLTWALLLVTLLMGHFFRDPERVVDPDPATVAAPADGKIISIERVPETVFFKSPYVRISIFMSVFDVHVNRIPLSGIVREVHYRKGRFLSANIPRAMRENEQNWIRIEGDAGAEVVVTQVAGLIARRIVCWPGAGDQVNKGERFGMIRFGSRLDLYVPENSEILAHVGDRVFGGETLVCRLN